jgi:hypothetical protein
MAGRRCARRETQEKEREGDVEPKQKVDSTLFFFDLFFFLAAPSFYIFAWEEKHEIESNRQVSRIQGHYIKKEHRGGRTRL